MAVKLQVETWLEQSITFKQANWNRAAGNLNDEELCRETTQINAFNLPTTQIRFSSQFNQVVSLSI